jgi:hypothetical protein
MPNFLSQLTKSEQARLLGDLNYMNLEEIRAFCSERGPIQGRGRVIEREGEGDQGHRSKTDRARPSPPLSQDREGRVEIYNGKPILYAIGHSAFDQPGYEKSKDGLVARVVIQGKKIARVSFVPVSRDDHNDVFMLEPSSEEGGRLLDIVRHVSPPELPLRTDGHEVVLLDSTATASTQARQK